MNLPFGFSIVRASRQKSAPAGLTSVNARGGWVAVIREGFTGAWQKNIELKQEDVLAYHAVYACVTLIASDIGKLRLKLTERDRDGIWNEVENSAYSPVLRRPNHYQNHIKFLEQWLVSKLIHGNTYILKARDARGVVRALYVLDPQRVRPMVAPDGAVYYQLSTDFLSKAPELSATVPAREIIHDVMVPLYHPLCGVSPISACGLAASQGLRIQRNSERFFANGAQPGGILTAPGTISPEDQKSIQEAWETEYSGDNTGKVAVLGNGLKYEAMSVNAVDAQLIEQLKYSAENVCTAFRVPPFKVGIGAAPAITSVEALNIQYYSQCLQNPIECVEALLDEGLDLPSHLATELDLDDLFKMDTPSKIKASAEAIGGGGMSPNESRRRFLGLGPVKGGEHPYLQQQNFSLEALAKRDQQEDPFKSTPAPPTPSSTPAPGARAIDPAEIRAIVLEQRAELRGEPGPAGKDGRDGIPGAKGEAGDAGAPGERGLQGEHGEKGDAGEIGPAGRDGVDGEKGDVGPAVDVAEIRAIVLEHKAELRGEPGQAGEPGPAGRDGVDGVAGERGLDGRDGRDGKDGINGRDGALGPEGQKGLDGKDGSDGFSLEDFSLDFDGERNVTLSFARGALQKTHTLVLPQWIYRGVFEEGREYQLGDMVTWGGSCWVARANTGAKPGQSSEASRAWQLAVKAGRDGREGKPGREGQQGPKGDKGDAGRNGY